MKKLATGVPFVGVTRFSVYTPNDAGWNTSARHKTDETSYLKELYAPERIEDRLRIFSELAAPIYQKFAEENDYTHLVQYSNEMPPAYKERLFEIADRYPVIKPVLVTNESMDESVRKFLMTWDPSFSGIFVWLRVDDDDVLSIDYLDALKKYAIDSNVGFAVSFSTIMVAQYACGRLLNFRQARFPKNSIGQAYICWANIGTNVIDMPKQLPHHDIDKYLPLLMDPRGIRGLQIRHAWQDTSNIDSLVGHRIAHRSFELGKLPNVNPTHVLEKFPTLKDNQPVIETDLSATVELRVDEWKDCSQLFAGFPDSSIIEVRWELEFDGSPDDGASVSLKFANPDYALGHYPRDDARGDYRRLHVNAKGTGGNFFVMPKDARLIGLRLNADGGAKNVRSGRLSFKQIGLFNSDAV